jgi:hypothetical protein
MMRKFELQVDDDSLSEFHARIASHLQLNHFEAALSDSRASLAHIEPAIKFRKREKLDPHGAYLLGLETICVYAPPLFAHAILCETYEFVKSSRLLRQLDVSYVDRLDAAIRLEETARLTWNYLEAHSAEHEQVLGGHILEDRTEVRAILDVWHRAGLILSNNVSHGHGLRFCTRLDDPLVGICPACGARGLGRRDLFYQKTHCKRCGVECFYHILPAEAHHSG